MSFSDIPIRVNATDIEAGWFNALRSAGVEQTGEFGSADIISGTSTTVVASVTVDSAIETISYIKAFYSYQRDTGSGIVNREGVFTISVDSVAIRSEEFQVDQGGAIEDTIAFSVTTQTISGTAKSIRLRAVYSGIGPAGVQGQVKVFMRKVYPG